MIKKRLAFLGLLGGLILSSCGTEELITTACNPIYVMDTTVSIVFYNTDNVDEHYKNIKAIYQEVDQVASKYFSGEELASIYDLNLNREITANDTLLDLLKLSEEAYSLTNGYYNPHIGRLSTIWKNAINNKSIPDDSLISSELAIMNSTSLEINNHNIRIIGDGDIDLGGIAKGYATKLAVDYLRNNGVKYYYIDAGNSSIALGSKNENDFNVGLSMPFKNGYFGVLATKDNMISTSSPKYQYFIKDDARYHHLISAYTGYPTNYYDSVTLMGVDNALGDAYSTAIFSMDIDQAKEFISNKEIDAILYKNDEIIYKSEELVLS